MHEALDLLIHGVLLFAPRTVRSCRGLRGQLLPRKSLAIGRLLVLAHFVDRLNAYWLVATTQVFLRVILEEVVNLGQVEVVKGYSPHEPVEVLLQLQVAPRHNQGVEGTGLHVGQAPAHLDLLLDPVAVSEVEQLSHEFDVSVHLDGLQVGLHLPLLLSLH